MKSIALKEMQKIELDLLLELDRVCGENNLRYYIDGGTLLGAMCYEGFIPWDDDIDIKMPRPDYEKLLNMADSLPSHITLDAPSKEHCEYTMLKLVDNRTVLIEESNGIKKETGVYLDVLPMDAHPNDSSECEKHIAKLQRYNSLFHNSLMHFSNLKSSKSIAARMKGCIYDMVYNPWKLYQKLTHTAKKYDYDSAQEVGLLVEGDPVKERFKKSWLEPELRMEFEGHMVAAPNNYRKHLAIFYGDHVLNPAYYHNLPRIDSNHNHKVFWRE